MAESPPPGPSPNVPPKRPKVTADPAVPHPGVGSQESQPPAFIRKLRKAAVGTGCDIRLRVSVAGFPKPRLSWYHNDDLLPPSEAQDPGGLWIRDCRTSDAGLYTCVATNQMGEASCSAVLAVMDLGEDSETTEDETTEPQVETKEGMMDYNPDASDRRATLPGAYDPVVERELRALGSRPPGLHPDPSDPARQALGGAPAEGGPPVRAPRKQETAHQPQIAEKDFKFFPGFALLCHFSCSFNKTLMKSTGENPNSDIRHSCSSALVTSHLHFPLNPHPSRTQTAEESQETSPHDPLFSPRPPANSHPNSIPNRDLDKDSPSDHRSETDQLSNANLDHQEPKISGKIRAFENRIASSEKPGGSAGGRVASPDSSDGVRKTGGPSREEARILQGAAQKRATFKQRASSLEDKTNYSQRVQSYQSKFTEELQRIKKLVGKPSLKKAFSSEQLSQKDRLAAEKLEPIPPQVVQKLEARERAMREREAREREGKSQALLQVKDAHSAAAKPGSSSPHGKRASPLTVGEAGAQRLPKTLQTPSPVPSVSPLLKRRKAETCPPVRVSIPTILVEDEPMEMECVSDERDKESSTRWKERRVLRSKMGPGSPEKGKTTIKSVENICGTYLSADGEMAEGPRFQTLLEDKVAPSDTAVVLKCVVTGRPPPTVTWRKDNVAIRSDAFHVVASEGDSHSLLIKQMRPSSVGSYCVTAVNPAGTASCSATVHVQPGKTDLWSSTKASKDCKHGSSDRLFPAKGFQRDLLEAMELGDSPASWKKVHFKEPPSFQVVPFDQAVTEVQDVVISAKVSGQPTPMVHWSKDRVPVKTAGRFAVQQTDNGTLELRISSAQRSDAGLYACRIINESGSRQAECRVDVRGAGDTTLTITREVADVAVKAGESVMLECHMAGPSDVDVDWLSNGKLIQPALLNCKMHFDGKRRDQTYQAALRASDDSGTYTCKLSTAKEELTSSANLKVTPSREPLFTRKLDVLEVTEGRSARFDCKVSGSPAPRVTWMHFEARVEEGENAHILQAGGRHSLVIAHVSNDSEGFYTAIAQNIHGQSECTAELYVQEHRAAISSHMAKMEKMPSIPEEPEVLESEVERRTMPDFVKPLADMEVVEGKEVALRCKVAGLPYPTISWYHNSRRIESSEERKMTQQRDVHSLVIRSACHAHGGVYKAVISNKVGKAACYAHLYVTDIVPEAPDGAPVIEAITGKTITISWKKPKKLDPSLDPGSLLYVVQQQPLGSIQWSVVASNLKETSYTITSLSKGVRYAFRVLASTGKTLSKPSLSTDLIQLLDRGPYLRKAPIILEKPDCVYVVENQPASITITLNHVHAVVTWKRRGVVLASKPGMYEMSMPDDDQHMLKLQRVRSTDVGQLVVMASNQFGSDLCALQLALAVRPKFETIMEDVDVYVGETTRLAVVVEGKPDPDILWYKDDVLLKESSHFTFVYDDPEYSLVILNACAEHSGVYTCTAKNLAGTNSCKAELTVRTEAEPMEDEGTILRKMRRLVDYYDVHKEIGRGAFSYVKRVTQKKAKAEFAAKFICARGKRKASALREMELLSELDHERILYFHDAFEKKNVVVLITDLCHEELLERMAKKTAVKELEIRWSIQQVLEGLWYLHQKNIAHLDIKPENILMASPTSDQIRICDFGNAAKLDPSEEYYCKLGTPEFVAPEIVNQTPVSTATDIWPVGVIAYLCLTGISPFAGENDRATALNIRNYNVAFEETMFSDLCREARGFVIKLLVVDRLRPSAAECLRHPWFKVSVRGQGINTALLKQVLSRRRWQRSLLSYKSKMVMRTIPELLNDSSNHVSIAVARHLKEGSPPPSSSSDSDADVDELPFIPMPLSMFFSSSRVSLNEIPGDEDVTASQMSRNTDDTGAVAEKDEEALKEENMEKTKRAPLKKGSSVETEDSETRARRATMRRGSSADSALLIHVESEEENSSSSEATNKSLKKAVSMELPHRSPSPGLAKISQEEYALKLELMRQRLLRGGNDKKMSGLRGPLFETLGIEDDRRTGSLDRNLRRSRTGPPSLARAASSESPAEDRPLTKVFCKSASFNQGDSEPMPLHRRYGAPLEIPAVGNGNTEGKKLQEATSMSALTEQATPESASPTKKTSFSLPALAGSDQQPKQNTVGELDDMDKAEWKKPDRKETRNSSSVSLAPLALLSNKAESRPNRVDTGKPNGMTSTNGATRPEHAAVFSKVATTLRPSAPSSSTAPRQPVLRTDIKNIDSEEIFEARFKKRESSLTRGLRKLTRNKSEEKSPTLSRKGAGGAEEVYRPGPKGAPLEMVSRGLQEKSKSVQDLRGEDKEPGLGLIGRFSLRAKRSVSWAVGRSKSLDTNEPSSTKRLQGEREERNAESSVSAMRRKFESKVAGMSAKVRTQSEERKDNDAAGCQKDPKRLTDSPITAIRHKFESKVAGLSSKIRSQSEERKDDPDERRTPLFARHRHSHSEGRGLKGMGIPENQLAKQTGTNASKDSLDSTSSLQSEKVPESDRRSRWDRWGLTRSRKDKSPSQPDLSSSSRKDEQQFIRAASDFAPVFHIKLKDHVLSEGEPATLSCLPAGSPPPRITWRKDRKLLEVDDRMSLISHPDGRQLLQIAKSNPKDDGVYECVASNPIATITTSCTLSVASVPKRPGTPEVAQTYNNTALVLWKPADTKSPCTYTLDRKTDGDSDWMTVATGVTDCYYNVTELPPGGTFRFRVTCSNKAGQGPASNSSGPVSLDPAGGRALPAATVGKTLPFPLEPVPPPKPVQNAPGTVNSCVSPPKSGAPPPSRTEVASSAPTQQNRDTQHFAASPPIKIPPPLITPKPQSPVNVVCPMTQSPPPAVTPPLTPTKPTVPTYAPVPVTSACVAPTPVIFSPQVLQSSSLSPFADGVTTPTKGTPSGRATPSTGLRQGVPQETLHLPGREGQGSLRRCPRVPGKRHGQNLPGQDRPLQPGEQTGGPEGVRDPESLHSEKIMALHEAYVTPRYLVLVAEFCSGKELLHSLIDRFRYSEDDVVGYLVQILQGVEYLHSRRVLHLDLKPDNIMVTNLNTIKIVDFGSAQSFNPLSLKQKDARTGSLEYMAPEMIKGEVVGPPADIWSIGVVTYIMLSGRLPFEDQDPRQVESKILVAKFDPSKLYPNVSQSASAFCKKMLSSYPWARPATRDCFAQAWLQDSYLMKLKRQTLTFTSNRLKEFLVEQQSRRSEGATKHKVLLRTYQSSPQSPGAGSTLHSPAPQ
uniref:non-specific serine/threonine protein kinase n=1 Tax=Tetraodon nigroviridis TaxID=99883 RepID=H3CSE2_TETNG